MPQEYTKDQFWELYKKLPLELKKTISSNETGDNLYEICQRHDILRNLYEITEYVGQTLLGVLTLADFQSIIEENLEIDPTSAKKVSREINRFVFYPVKTFLGDTYNIDFIPTIKEEVSLSLPKTPPRDRKDDSYREIVS